MTVDDSVSTTAEPIDDALMAKLRAALGDREFADWDESKHPRDDKGRFDEVADAVMSAMKSGEPVDIPAHHLRALLDKAAAHAEHLDMAHVSVNGEPVFRGLGIARKDMPQVPSAHHEMFLQDLRQRGISVSDEQVSPATLRATQGQIDAKQVGQYLKRYEPGQKPRASFVSKDGFILDGHHRWATLAAAQISGMDPEVKAPVIRIGLPHRAALDAMRSYNSKHGIQALAHGVHKAIAAREWPCIQPDDVLYDTDMTLAEEVGMGLECPHCGAAVRYVGIGMADWDESKHPRDDHGRFTEGLSDNHFEDAASHGIDPETLRQVHRDIIANATTDAERRHAGEIAIAEAIARETIHHGDTASLYKLPDGSYTPEREQVHDKVIEKFFSDHMDKHGMLPPMGLEHPTATFMAGLSGAGKSTSAKDILVDGAGKVVMLDPDHLKQYLPEYKNGLGAARLARESGDIADRLMEIAVANRMNVVVDGTMKTSGTPAPAMSDGALGRMAALRDKGYRVEVRYVDVTIDQSVQRVVERYISQKRETGHGRYVTPSFPRSLKDDTHGSRPKASFEMAKNTSYKGRPLVDAWTHHNGWTGEKVASHGTLSPGGAGE